MNSPKFCHECKWSLVDTSYLRCHNITVNAMHYQALGAINDLANVSCRDERSRWSTFAPCGRKGKLWEAQES